MTIIDRSEQIESIKQKYGRDYYRSPKAQAEAAAVWGLGANKHGVSRKGEKSLSRNPAAALPRCATP